MPIRVAVPKESESGERRVALVPEVVQRLAKLGVEVHLQKGAGDKTHIPDEAYAEAKLTGGGKALWGSADVVLKVQPPTEKEIDQMREGAMVIGFMAAHRHPERVAKLRDRKITSFAMELVPRISRAQSMDALSSQAAAAGYKAALMAANLSSRFFPMLTTAAGTIRPSKVLVIGAGVAGLQAIATARRLGAVVSAYDVRSATKEQVESLGAKFVQLSITAEGEGGYARELTDEERGQQQEELGQHIAEQDAVVTTAAIPGKPAPTIVRQADVENMKPGAVIVDLAAEQGGNCELTQTGKTIEHRGVVVDGPVNVPSMLATHASEMYAKNLLNFLTLMIRDGELSLDWDDQVLAESALTRDGEIVHAATRAQVEGGTQ